VRGVTDVEGEIALANLNRALAPEIETVFVPADPGLSDVSSSRLKELARAGADLSQICPPALVERLHARVGEQPREGQPERNPATEVPHV
jgi:pantetheine-phosphate adenylyltransferase